MEIVRILFWTDPNIVFPLSIDSKFQIWLPSVQFIPKFSNISCQSLMSPVLTVHAIVSSPQHFRWTRCLTEYFVKCSSSKHAPELCECEAHITHSSVRFGLCLGIESSKTRFQIWWKILIIILPMELHLTPRHINICICMHHKNDIIYSKSVVISSQLLPRAPEITFILEQL